jgi:hypothetical protein
VWAVIDLHLAEQHDANTRALAFRNGGAQLEEKRLNSAQRTLAETGREKISSRVLAWARFILKMVPI